MIWSRNELDALALLVQIHPQSLYIYINCMEMISCGIRENLEENDTYDNFITRNNNFYYKIFINGIIFQFLNNIFRK